jgi:hypothetical protein
VGWGEEGVWGGVRRGCGVGWGGCFGDCNCGEQCKQWISQCMCSMCAARSPLTELSCLHQNCEFTVVQL